MGEKEDRALEYETLEARGEVEVRRVLLEGRMLGPRAVVAQTWLREKEEARRAEAERKSDASQAEQLEIARAASAAAERAAVAAEKAAAAAELDAAEARKANTRATMALVIAAISATVAIIGMFLHH